MPLIGKVHATPYERTLADMKVGEEMFMDPDYVFVIRLFVLMAWTSPVIHEDDLPEDPELEYIRIKRIGDGRKDEDFEVDFGNVLQVFKLEPKERVVKLTDDKESYLFVSRRVKKEKSDSSNLKDKSIEDLKILLAKIVEGDDPDYTQAAAIQKEIAERAEKK